MENEGPPEDATEDASVDAGPEARVDPVAPGEAVELASLRDQLRSATSRADELSARWQRTQADFINYKRRAEQERAEAQKSANLALIAHLLPVLDDFERAFATLPKELQRLSWLDGVALIMRKLQYILEQEGLSPIESLGKDFDPLVHEAVVVEEGVSLQNGKVVAEFQRGYQLHDRLVRPALVKVGGGTAEAGKE